MGRFEQSASSSLDITHHTMPPPTPTRPGAAGHRVVINTNTPPHRQQSRPLLTPPLPSLDSVVAIVSSTPPIPTFTFSNTPQSYFASFGQPQQTDPSVNGFYHDSILTDPPGSCSVKTDVWIGAQLSSPPSPATIDSTTDSQAGGEFFPPSSESVNGDSPTTQQERRALSLSISGLPPNLQLGAGLSPASLVSSSAPFTDNLSLGMDPAEDYFHFHEASMGPGPSAEAQAAQAICDQAQQQQQRQQLAASQAAAGGASAPVSSHPTPSSQHQQQLQQQPQQGGAMTAPSTTGTFGYRLPASQPSSPIRGVFHPGQGGQHSLAMSSAGRQRGATVSGMPQQEYAGLFNYSNVNGVPLVAAVPVASVVSAVQSHLAFSTIQPTPPQVVSPVTERPPSHNTSFLGDPASAALGVGVGVGGVDVTMEDAQATAQAQAQGQLAAASRRSSGSQGPGSVPVSVAPAVAQQNVAASVQAASEAVERLTLERLTMIDNIVSQAHSAREALLRGQNDRVPEALGQISTQLEIASDLGVAPTHAHRETTPASGSQGISPLTYSPTAQTTATAAATAMLTGQPGPVGAGSANNHTQAMPMAPVVPALPSLLPALPIGQTSMGMVAPQPTVTSPVAMAGPAYMPVATSQGLTSQPLVHSHSYPNGGHQMSNQMHPAVATMPSTPISANTNFSAAMTQHVPMFSSPLAVLPPSRPTSPKQYGTWLPENVNAAGNASAAAAAVAAATGMPPMVNGQLAQAQAQALAQVQAQAQAQAAASAAQASAEGIKSRRPSMAEQRADGRPIARGRSASVAKPGSLSLTPNVSLPPSAWQSRQGSPVDEDDDDDEGSDDEAPRRPKRRRSSAGPDANEAAGLNSSVAISDDIRQQLDQIFTDFLNKVCQDLEISDAKGEKLHQVLMPKKMAKLDESKDFRPFKFRIQAFTNKFHQELLSRGITEETLSVKKVKTYLWHQELISRFNADGKKAKSKGNHIWHVDAKKLPSGNYIFRAFQRKIIGTPQAFAVVNQRYEWEPKIWDPMAPSTSIKPSFSSPMGSLPPWLVWEDETRLVGVPEGPQPPIHVVATAHFVDGAGNPAELETSFTIAVIDQMMTMPPQPMDPAQGGYGQPQMVSQWMGPDMDLGAVQMVQPGMAYTTSVPMYHPQGYGV